MASDVALRASWRQAPSWRRESKAHRKVSPLAPHREAEAVLRRRPVLHELPRRRIVVERRLEGDLGRTGRLELEGEVTERQGEAEAARLDVGLLQRPVVEEGFGLFVRSEEHTS